jgi:hypothetical protein
MGIKLLFSKFFKTKYPKSKNFKKSYWILQMAQKTPEKSIFFALAPPKKFGAHPYRMG